MYLDIIAATIRSHIPLDSLPSQNVEDLLRLYAVLLRAKGTEVTQSDVHDAWSAWKAANDPNHASLVAYNSLPHNVQQEDQVFAEAIRRASIELGQISPSQREFSEVLFPFGPPKDDPTHTQPHIEALELYKIMVASSEALVNRRQTVNTFFLTINAAIVTAVGLIVQYSVAKPIFGALGALVLAVTGVVLCTTWGSLIKSFGQLNGGKFKVINTIERCLSVSIFAAEWEALSRGTNPKIYRSFTSRELWVPNVLLIVHIAMGLFCIWYLITQGSTA